MALASIAIGGCRQPAEQRSAVLPPEPLEQTDATSAAQQYADRLTGAIARPQAAPVGGYPDVHWIEPGTTLVRAGERGTVEIEKLETEAPTETAPPPVIDIEPAAPQPVRSRHTLLRELLDEVHAGDDPALTKALIAVALSIADEHRDLDHRLLATLSPQQQEQVHRFHKLMLEMERQVRENGDTLDRASVAKKLDDWFGEQPVSIDRIELCKRVGGFGVFDAFEDTTFLAGQAQEMIVYVEVDDFRPIETAGQQFEVHLSQEVVLFNEADGLAVWRHEPVEIRDRSRNKRNDFFTVQRVSLPARLTVGRYRMKVRVTDKHGGSIDEQTLPIEIVADRALAWQDEAEDRPLGRTPRP